MTQSEVLAVQVRLDCIKLEFSELTLHSYYDSRLRLSFESLLELQSDIQKDPMQFTPHVHPPSDMHHYQRPCAFLNEAKVTVVNAVKTPEAHRWVEAHNTEIIPECFVLLSFPMLQPVHL